MFGVKGFCPNPRPPAELGGECGDAWSNLQARPPQARYLDSEASG